MGDKADRFAWDYEDLVFDFLKPEGRPIVAAPDEKVEKDQYAEIADRDPRFAGEHQTPASGGNVGRQTRRTASARVEKVTPEGNESQEKYMDRCIHTLVSEGKTPKKSADQCYAIWHESKGTSRKSQDGEAVKKSALVRLVTKGATRLAMTFVRKASDG
jgi:hypothetical protein